MSRIRVFPANHKTRGLGRGPSRSAPLLGRWPADVALRAEAGTIDLSQIRRVLVVRLDEIGDVVMTGPLLRELRRNLPHAWIVLLVKPTIYNLVELCPYVNEVLTYDRQGGGHWRRYCRFLLTAGRLRRRRFDLAIVPRWDVDRYHAALMVRASGAHRRLGYSEQVTEDKRRLCRGHDNLFTHVVDDRTVKHEVQRNLDVIRFLGGAVQDDHLELWLDREDETWARKFLRNQGGRAEPLAAFCPGAGHPKRMWPASHFAELGKWLKQRFDFRIVLIGGPGDTGVSRQLEKTIAEAVINLTGRTTLRQTAALLKRCAVYVGNDSGPMHIAAAMGIGVVEVSCHPRGGLEKHENSPTRFAPWGVSHRILQPNTPLPPCTTACTADRSHCISGVSVAEVKGAVAAVLSNPTARFGNAILSDRDNTR